MLEIVLLILKIAGIILAAVLGILIVALICVLFVPVWYRGDFSLSGAQEGEKKEIFAVFRASWLLRLVRVYAAYEDAPRVRLKLLFFTLLDTAKEKRAKRDKGEKSRYEEETRDAALAEEKVPAEPVGERKSGNKEKETAADTVETEASDKQSAEQKGKESAKESFQIRIFILRIAGLSAHPFNHRTGKPT